MYKYLERHKGEPDKCELQIYTEELIRCQKDPMYFFDNYVVVKNDKYNKNYKKK